MNRKTRLDGYFEVGRDVHDAVAGAMLVYEARGCVSDFSGAPFGWDSGIIAAAAGLEPALSRIITAARPVLAGSLTDSWR